MKSDNVDNIFILTILLSIIGDSLGLFAALLNQRSKKKAEQERREKEEKVNQEVVDLRKRIELLEKQLRTV